MFLKTIRIDRQTYGDDKGKLLGSMTVDSDKAEVSIKISDDRAQQIVALIAAELVAQARETAAMITADIIEAVPQIGADDA